MKNKTTYLLILSIALFVVSFIVPSRLSDYTFDELLNHLTSSFLNYIHFYSLFLFPVIVALSFTRLLAISLILSTALVILTASLADGIVYFLSIKMPFIDFIFEVLGIILIIVTVMTLKSKKINKTIKISLITLSIIFFLLNITLSFTTHYPTYKLVCLVIFFIILYGSTGLIPSWTSKVIFAIISLIAIVILTDELVCYRYAQSWNIFQVVSSSFKSCGTFYFWLLSALFINYFLYLKLLDQKKERISAHNPL